MKVSIDADKCSGHGRCGALASQVYSLDDVGYALLRGQGEFEVAAEDEQAAKLGAESCPERAISLTP
jgi:ferredoxin